jgi:hypothetical protein
LIKIQKSAACIQKFLSNSGNSLLVTNCAQNYYKTLFARFINKSIQKPILQEEDLQKNNQQK